MSHAARLAFFLALPLASFVYAQAPGHLAGAPASREEHARPTHWDGLFPLDWNSHDGKLLLTIPAMGEDFLLLDQLPYGVGSNDLELDRGQLGTPRVVHFYRSGPKVLLVERNLDYRSSSLDPSEQAAVEQSFAQSVLWGFKVDHEDAAAGSVTVDATDFFLRDAHRVGERLTEAKQGAYKLDSERSAIAPELIKNFPKNTEVEAVLTFHSEGAVTGQAIASVTPDPHDVTVHEHTSLIALPEPGYLPRAYDVRAGFFPMSYRDYSAPLGAPIDQHFITRHRLIKKDPTAAVSEPVEPIVYYVDRGAPEPIRSALLEGASWWAQAFEAAGFKDAFQVKLLPPDADPMDIRYNMIQWVHRSTRGWSYGYGVTDPRTGEIIKGQVTLGSLRARQDFLIGEALTLPYTAGASLDEAQAPIRAMVLARLRQLAAHEVGHTLGLAHNFAASSVGQGTSVMDYPQPLVTLGADGTPDLSHAYAAGVGAWDKVAITYGYAQPSAGELGAGDERSFLDGTMRRATDAGLLFITDEDARPLGSLQPHAHLWDNGPDPADELVRMLAVRKAALARFGEHAIEPGAPLASLGDALVPLYLYHRYQTEAAAKEIGGLDYRYALRGDGQPAMHVVPVADQKKALAAVLATLAPDALTLPEPLLALLPPRPPGYPATRESFGGHTGLAFDPQGAVEAAADLSCSLLFEPSRAARLVEYRSRDNAQLALTDMIAAVLGATWYAPRLTGQQLQTQLTVDHAVLVHLLALGSSEEAGPTVRELAARQINALKIWLEAKTDPNLNLAFAAHWKAGLDEIVDWEKNPSKYSHPAPVQVPPGQPIGEDE